MFHSEATVHLDIERKAKSRAKIWAKCFNFLWKKLQWTGFVCFGFFGGYVFKFSLMGQFNNLMSFSHVWNIPPHLFHSSNTFCCLLSPRWKPPNLPSFVFVCLDPASVFFGYSAKCAPSNDPTDDWHPTTLDYNFKLEETLWALWRSYLSIFSLHCDFLYDGGSTFLRSKCFL